MKIAHIALCLALLGICGAATGQTMPDTNSTLDNLVVIENPVPPAANPADPVMAKVIQRIAVSNQAKPLRMKCRKVKIITDLSGAKFFKDPNTSQLTPDPKTVRVKKIEVYDVYGKEVADKDGHKSWVMMQKLVKVKENADRDSRENNERDIAEDCARCRDVNQEEYLGTDLNNPSFLPKFTYQLMETTGESYVIKFTPKENQPVVEEEDEVYNRSEGYAYVDTKRNFIHLFRGNIVRPFRKNIVGINQFDLTIEQGEIDDIVFTQRITITVRYKIGFGFLSSNTFEQHRIQFKNFVILPPPPPPEGTPAPPK